MQGVALVNECGLYLTGKKTKIETLPLRPRHMSLEDIFCSYSLLSHSCMSPLVFEYAALVRNTSVTAEQAVLQTGLEHGLAKHAHIMLAVAKRRTD